MERYPPALFIEGAVCPDVSCVGTWERYEQRVWREGLGCRFFPIMGHEMGDGMDGEGASAALPRTTLKDCAHRDGGALQLCILAVAGLVPRRRVVPLVVQQAGHQCHRGVLWSGRATTWHGMRRAPEPDPESLDIDVTFFWHLALAPLFLAR